VSLDREAIEQRLDTDPAIVANLADTIQTYFLLREPRPDRKRRAGNFDRLHEESATTLCRDVLLFALAHEYGHIVAMKRNLGTNPQLSDALSREISADGWSVVFSMAASDGGYRDIATILWGLKVFLATRAQPSNITACGGHDRTAC
jgi:hypothetical protein